MSPQEVRQPMIPLEHDLISKEFQLCSDIDIVLHQTFYIWIKGSDTGAVDRGADVAGMNLCKYRLLYVTQRQICLVRNGCGNVF